YGVVDPIRDLDHYISVHDHRVIVVAVRIAHLGEVAHGAIVVQTVDYALIRMSVTVGATRAEDGSHGVECPNIVGIGGMSRTVVIDPDNLHFLTDAFGNITFDVVVGISKGTDRILTVRVTASDEVKLAPIEPQG